MSWSLGDASAPDGPVVQTVEMREHLRLVGGADDDYISGLVAAATAYLQQYTGRLVYSQTIVEYVDDFPAEREMPLHCYPITSVVLKYYDADDTLTTMSGSDYWVHTAKKPCSVEITGGDTLPLADVRHAIKIIVGFWFEQPDETQINIPAAAKALMLQHRIFR